MRCHKTVTQLSQKHSPDGLGQAHQDRHGGDRIREKLTGDLMSFVKLTTSALAIAAADRVMSGTRSETRVERKALKEGTL